MVNVLLLLFVLCLTTFTPVSAKAGGVRGGVSSKLYGESFFEDWRSAKEMFEFIDHLGKTHKSSGNVRVEVLGKSYERRPIKMITIGPKEATQRVFLMGTIHGREWISPMSLCYLAWQLLQPSLSSTADPDLFRLLQSTKVHILPLLNPDGYEYTRVKTGDAARLWRKNRRNLCPTCDRAAHGVDLNRNWGVPHVTFGFGATKSTLETYQGKKPFSEPELKAIQKWLLKYGPSVDFFLDVHCCSSEVLPPTYYHDEPQSLIDEDLQIAARIAKVMKEVNGFKYKSRPREAEFSPTNSGISVDWIYGEAKVKKVFIVEARGNEKSHKLDQIFLMEQRQIVPVSKEVEAAFWQSMREISQAGSGDVQVVPDDASGSDEAQEEMDTSTDVDNVDVDEGESLSEAGPSDAFSVQEEDNFDDIGSDLQGLVGKSFGEEEEKLPMIDTEGGPGDSEDDLSQQIGDVTGEELVQEDDDESVQPSNDEDEDTFDQVQDHSEQDMNSDDVLLGGGDDDDEEDDLGLGNEVHGVEETVDQNLNDEMDTQNVDIAEENDFASDNQEIENDELKESLDGDSDDHNMLMGDNHNDNDDDDMDLFKSLSSGAAAENTEMHEDVEDELSALGLGASKSNDDSAVDEFAIPDLPSSAHTSDSEKDVANMAFKNDATTGERDPNAGRSEKLTASASDEDDDDFDLDKLAMELLGPRHRAAEQRKTVDNQLLEDDASDDAILEEADNLLGPSKHQHQFEPHMLHLHSFGGTKAKSRFGNVVKAMLAVACMGGLYVMSRKLKWCMVKPATHMN